MRLRPHHLLCLQKYTGHGYSEEFVCRMDIVTDRLKNNPDILMELVEGRDMLCEACPNMSGSVCSSNEKVLSIDKNVLMACELAYGVTDSWDKLSKLAEGIVLDTAQFEIICGDCQWYDMCSKTKRGIIYE